jgi:hypothetical protein
MNFSLSRVGVFVVVVGWVVLSAVRFGHGHAVVRGHGVV